jgi:hypothetical protein
MESYLREAARISSILKSNTQNLLMLYPAKF